MNQKTTLIETKYRINFSCWVLQLFIIMISCTRIHPYLVRRPTDSQEIKTVRVIMNGNDSARASKLWGKEINDSITSVCPNYVLLRMYVSTDYWEGKASHYPKKDGKRTVWEVDSTQPKIKYWNHDFKCN